MNRRDLISKLLAESVSLSGAILCSSCGTLAKKTRQNAKRSAPKQIFRPQRESSAQPETQTKIGQNQSYTTLSNDYLNKTANFDRDHPEDLFISQEKLKLLFSCNHKLKNCEKYVGYGNFNLLCFDQFVHQCKRIPKMEPLSKKELEFLEETFYFNAFKYGFYGKKVTTNITNKIKRKEVIKIPQSGHYLFKEASLPIYKHIQQDIGDSIILTSGVRSVVKQMRLFLSKTISVEGNLSKASRSLAPPGHSYHAIGDFDVGKRGFGAFNFTDKFSSTSEYKKLTQLGYVEIRYPTENPFGVRFEPWHIEGSQRQS